jgi:short-subunit dehydrogenase
MNIFLTGASKGIGRGIAVGLANEGAKMLLVARSEVELESLRQEISINGADHHCFVIDLMSANGPASLIAEIKEKGLRKLRVESRSKILKQYL